MHAPRSHQVTALLLDWRRGDDAALGRLMPLVHCELRRLARRQMVGESPGHVLQATALVNEAYLRLIDIRRVQWQDRAHFFAMSARIMRRVLVDAARRRKNQRRGGGLRRVSLDTNLRASGGPPEDVLAVDEALEALATLYARKAKVVELRFFAGLDVEQTAEALGVSQETVLRDWRFARSWLARALAHAEPARR